MQTPATALKTRAPLAFLCAGAKRFVTRSLYGPCAQSPSSGTFAASPQVGPASLLAALLAIGASFAPPLQAEVRLPKIFGSHMVLQQEKPLVIWGWAQPNETVALQLGPESGQAQANDRGQWRAVLPAMKAGGPFTLAVRGSSTVELDDVMIGEVWLASGQSNMEMGIGAASMPERKSPPPITPASAS